MEFLYPIDDDLSWMDLDAGYLNNTGAMDAQHYRDCGCILCMDPHFVAQNQRAWDAPHFLPEPNYGAGDVHMVGYEFGVANDLTLMEAVDQYATVPAAVPTVDASTPATPLTCTREEPPTARKARSPPIAAPGSRPRPTHRKRKSEEALPPLAGDSNPNRSKRSKGQRQNVKLIRKISPCLRCGFDKERCSVGTICDTCQKKSPRKNQRDNSIPLWRTVCVRIKLSKMIQQERTVFSIPSNTISAFDWDMWDLSGKVPAPYRLLMLARSLVTIELLIYGLLHQDQGYQDNIIKASLKGHLSISNVAQMCLRGRVDADINLGELKLDIPRICAIIRHLRDMNMMNPMDSYLDFIGQEYTKDAPGEATEGAPEEETEGAPYDVAEDAPGKAPHENAMYDPSANVPYDLAKIYQPKVLSCRIQETARHLIFHLSLLRLICEEIDDLTKKRSEWCRYRLLLLLGGIRFLRESIQKSDQHRPIEWRKARLGADLKRSLAMTEFISRALESFQSFVEERIKANYVFNLEEHMKVDVVWYFRSVGD